MDLVEYNIETAVITALETKYKDITITDGKSYALVMKGLGEYRELRLKIDDRHKDLKKDALEYGRAVDAEKTRLKALLAPGEEHLKGVRQVEDDKKAKIKEEKEAKDKERIDSIWEKINSFFPLSVSEDINSAAIQNHLSIIKGIEVTHDAYMEFTKQAQEKKEESIVALTNAYDKRSKWEQGEIERKAEVERLEKVRKEQGEAQKKIDEANKEIEEKKKALEQEEFERQATIKAEAEAKDKIEQKENERLEKEAADSKERLRQESLKPDKEKLIKFADELNNVGIPYVRSEKAKEALSNASKGLDIIAENIKDQANKL